MKRDQVSFGVVVVVTVGVLAALNEAPRLLGGEPRDIVRYASVEALEARHGRVWRPAAMPAPWTWPPTRIRFAVGDPAWVELEFAAGDHTLAICQAMSGRASGGRASSAPAEQDVPGTLLPSGESLQTIDTSIAGRDAQLRRLLLDDGTIVHEMWWRDGTTRMMLRLRGAADGLPAVAHALLGQR